MVIIRNLTINQNEKQNAIENQRVSKLVEIISEVDPQGFR